MHFRNYTSIDELLNKYSMAEYTNTLYKVVTEKYLNDPSAILGPWSLSETSQWKGNSSAYFADSKEQALLWAEIAYIEDHVVSARDYIVLLTLEISTVKSIDNYEMGIEIVIPINDIIDIKISNEERISMEGVLQGSRYKNLE